VSNPVRPAPPGNGAARSGSVLVVDDHAVVREGLRAVLAAAQGVVVVGDAADEEAGIELVARRRPDLVLIEPRMPGMGGVEAARRIAARHPATRVAMFTARADQDLLWEALDAGAHGFILKDTESPALVAVIRRLLAGETFVDPRLAPEFLAPEPAPRRPEGPLSAREREVLQMLADGLSNREVSERLVVSAETVKTHVKNILVKLEAKDRAQAVAIGIRQALID
jgi:DNA-binding NarL/FixJ family response regulator